MQQKTTAPTIYLVGDAILDNYATLTNKEQDLTKELTDLGFSVHNFAVDQMKVQNIIHGISPDNKYLSTRSYKYPKQGDGKMYPLKEVINLTKVNKSFSSMYDNVGISSFGTNIKPDNMMVISAIGNDIGGSMSRIILGAEYFVSGILTPQFISNYKKVVETAKSTCDRVVLVSLYLPYLGFGSSYGIYSPYSVPIITKLCDFVRNIGKEYNVAVIDLSKSLDVGNKAHYCGDSNDRLSNLSNTCFAKCLQYIYNHYNGYRMYYAPDLNYNKIVVE